MYRSRRSVIDVRWSAVNVSPLKSRDPWYRDTIVVNTQLSETRKLHYNNNTPHALGLIVSKFHLYCAAINIKIRALTAWALLTFDGEDEWEKGEKEIGSAMGVRIETTRLDLFATGANSPVFWSTPKPLLTRSGSLGLAIGFAPVSIYLLSVSLSLSIFIQIISSGFASF